MEAARQFRNGGLSEALGERQRTLDVQFHQLILTSAASRGAFAFTDARTRPILGWRDVGMRGLAGTYSGAHLVGLVFDEILFGPTDFC